MTKKEILTREHRLSQLMDGEWHKLDRSECVASLCADASLRSKWARYHMIRDVMKNEPVQADLALVSRICSAVDREPAYTNITPFSAAGKGARLDTPVSEDSPVTMEESGASADAVGSTDDNEAAISAPAQPLSRSQAEAEAERSDAVRKRSWANTGVAGFALAASVALITVVGVNVFEQQSSSGVPVVGNAPEAGVADLSTSVAQTQQTNATTSGSDAIQTPQVGAVDDSIAVLPVVDFVANTSGAYWVSPESSMRVSDEERLNMMLSDHIENSPTASREGLLPYSRLVGYRTLEQGH